MPDDLFRWLDALWNKSQPRGTFPVYVAHRFLASEQDLAQAARTLRAEVREPDLIFRTWQGLLPEAPGAPRLSYPAAKKLPKAEELTLRIMAVEGESRVVVEEEQLLVEQMGKLLELYEEYGVEPPEELYGPDEEQVTSESQERGRGGLLDEVG